MKIFHQSNGRIMEEYIKARENAKPSKGGIESHQLWLFRNIKLVFRVEVVLEHMHGGGSGGRETEMVCLY